MTQNDRPNGDPSTKIPATEVPATEVPATEVPANDRRTPDGQTSDGQTSDPREHGKFSINEDWAAVVVGLALLAAALTGLIPDGIIP